MRIAVAGGGPGGLFFATLMRRADPSVSVTVFERNRAEDTFGFGVVFSDRTLAGIHAADPVLRDALTEHGVALGRDRGAAARESGTAAAATAWPRSCAARCCGCCRSGPREPGWSCGSATEADADAVLAATTWWWRPTARTRGPRERFARRVRHRGRDRDREVHLVRHRLPLRRADVRARARPARRLRRARVPDRQRRLDLHRGDRRAVLAAGRASTSST